jgi:hypothetical protein
MIANYKNLTKEKYLQKMLEVIDCMQLDSSNHTSPSEKKLLIHFLTLPEKYWPFMFSPMSKKEVSKKLEKEQGKRPSHQSINNKIYNLINKGLLWRDNDGQIYLKPYLRKAVNNLYEALDTGNHYDFVFRFQ